MNRALQRLLARDRSERVHTWIASVCATGLHAAAAFAMAAQPPEPALPMVTQVTLDTRPPPAPPKPVEEPPPPEPEPARVRRPRAEPPSPPPVARPAALLTAPESAASAGPMRFASDPTNSAQSYGLVARGATAAPAPVPVAAPKVAAEPRAEPIISADRLSRLPRLPIADGCRADFPARARSDRAEVQVLATVRADGSLAKLRVESERPEEEGFASAARACVLRQRFEPALDREGKAVAAMARVTIRFAR